MRTIIYNFRFWPLTRSFIHSLHRSLSLSFLISGCSVYLSIHFHVQLLVFDLENSGSLSAPNTTLAIVVTAQEKG